jgi:transitional endoplasmic reticulum ATPase
MEEDTGVEEDDLVPEIMPRHFEEAVRNARRSVSDRDLAQYSQFAQNLQQSRSQLTSGGGSLASFQFPQAQRGAGGGSGGVQHNRPGAIQEEEEEDLYS